MERVIPVGARAATRRPPCVAGHRNGYMPVVVAAQGSSRASVRVWDAVLVVWVAACCGLAVWTAVEIKGLTDISDTLESSGRALETTATGLDRIGDIPFVGGQVSEVVDRLRETADSARANAASTRTTIDRISLLIGATIVVIAVIPPVVAYLAVRPTIRRRGRAP